MGLPALFGVGLTIHVEKLVTMAMRVLQQQHNTAQSARRLAGADVLVCANGGGMLAERMAITAELWAAGVSAEMLHVQRPSQKMQYDYAELHGMHAHVTLHRDEYSASHVVKPEVRSTELNLGCDICWYQKMAWKQMNGIQLVECWKEWCWKESCSCSCVLKWAPRKADIMMVRDVLQVKFLNQRGEEDVMVKDFMHSSLSLT